MPKITKPLRTKHEKLLANVDRLQTEIFAAAHPRRDIVFSECRKLAPQSTVAAYDDALSTLGRAWRASHGASIFFNN